MDNAVGDGAGELLLDASPFVTAIACRLQFMSKMSP